MVYCVGCHNLTVLSADAVTIIFPFSYKGHIAFTDCVCAIIPPTSYILSFLIPPTFICPSFEPA